MQQTLVILLLSIVIIASLIQLSASQTCSTTCSCSGVPVPCSSVCGIHAFKSYTTCATISTAASLPVAHCNAVSGGSFENDLLCVEYFQSPVISESWATIANLTEENVNDALIDSEDAYATSFAVAYNLESIGGDTETTETTASLGYSEGLPVLISSDDMVSSMYVLGGGSCADSNPIDVVFNQDTFSGCTVEYTAGLLQQECTNSLGDSQYAKSSTQYLSTIDNHIMSVFAYADPTVEEYVGVYRPEPINSIEAHWDPSTSTCSHLVTGFEYEVLTARFNNGSSDVDLWKIVGVKRNLIYSTWQFPDNKVIASFTMQWSVRFVRYPEQRKEKLIYPKPAIAISLPDDIFYPFSLMFFSAASPMSVSHSQWIHIVTAIVSVLLLPYL